MEEIKSVPCIKCGREIAPNAVFCTECLEDMEKHPVAPGTPVVLHDKPVFASRRAPNRKSRKPEDQVRSLKTTVAWLSAGVVLLAVVLTVVTCLWLSASNQTPDAPPPGENYQTSQTDTTT